MIRFAHKPSLQGSVLLSVVVLHCAFTFIYALSRLYSYKASLLDIGTFNQVLWNFLHHGVPLATTNPPYIPQNWLGFHFSAILIILAPFYALWPHLELFQIIQSLCLSLSGAILFYALKAAGARDGEAALGSFFYWINPFVISGALWDFHEIAFATLFISIALWALFAKRFAFLLLAMVLLLLTKEHYGFSVAGFGFLWGRRHHEWKRAWGIMALGSISFAVILLWIMPALHGDTHAMLSHSGDFTDRYSWLSSPFSERIAIFSNLLFTQSATNISGFIYLVTLLLCAPGFVMSLLAPLYLAPGLSDLAANLLSNNSMPRNIAAYHSTALIPVLVSASYMGYRKIITRNPSFKGTIVLLAAMVFFAVGRPLLFFPFTFWQLQEPRLTYEATSINAIDHLLPQETSVSAQMNIGMFFSSRPTIYPFPQQWDRSDAVILYLAQPYSNDTPRLGSPYGIDSAHYFEEARSVLHSAQFHIAYWQSPWLLLMRGTLQGNDRAKQQEAILQQIDRIEKR